MHFIQIGCKALFVSNNIEGPVGFDMVLGTVMISTWVVNFQNFQGRRKEVVLAILRLFDVETEGSR